MLIVEHRLGFIMANAGVDRSNVPPSAGAEPVLLLPEDPDAAAEACARNLKSTSASASASSSTTASAGRGGAAPSASRSASPASQRLTICAASPTSTAIRCGSPRRRWRDELAAAASLLMGQADEGHPVVLVSGLPPTDESIPARALIRPASEDLFR